MFGLGKKNSLESGTVKKEASQPAVAALDIADEKFTVMPQQYLPKAGSAPARRVIPKKALLLGGVVVLVLGGLFAALYAVFLSPKPPSSPSAPERSNVSQEQSAGQPASSSQAPAISETVISGQSFDENNILTGSLTATIPATVAQQYGSGIGVTVLSQADLTLPEQGAVLGGLYSIYPAGITFEEPILVELSVVSIPESYKPSDIYPAFLRGVRWEAFPDYQVTASGFTTMLEKIPSGPIAVIAAPEEVAPVASNLTFAHLPPTIDTDQDGLTDAEESLFGLNSTSADSDSDSYLDLEEIKNGYNPLAGDGAKLASSGLFAAYTNATYGYRADYPASWLADALDQTNKQVLFISSSEEFFEILIVENPLNTPIADWFRAQSPSLKNIDLSVGVLDGHPSVWSPDGQTLYAGAGGFVYIITYNSGTREDISWPNVFEHFYGSFKFGITSTQSAAPEGETATSTGQGSAGE